MPHTSRIPILNACQARLFAGAMVMVPFFAAGIMSVMPHAPQIGAMVPFELRTLLTLRTLLILLIRCMFAGAMVPFFAAGISSVMHPSNPHCPTMHFNYR